jgi:hypothetical protein
MNNEEEKNNFFLIIFIFVFKIPSKFLFLIIINNKLNFKFIKFLKFLIFFSI